MSSSSCIGFGGIYVLENVGGSGLSRLDIFEALSNSQVRTDNHDGRSPPTQTQTHWGW